MESIPADALYPCNAKDVDKERLSQVILQIHFIYAMLPDQLSIGAALNGQLFLLRTAVSQTGSYGKNTALAHVAERDGAFFVIHGDTETPYSDIRRALAGLYSVAADAAPAHRDEILAARKFEEQRCAIFENFVRSSNRITAGATRSSNGVNVRTVLPEVRVTFLDMPGTVTAFRKILTFPADSHIRITVPDSSKHTGVREILTVEQTHAGKFALGVDGRRKRWFRDYGRARKALFKAACRHPAIVANCSGHQLLDIEAMALPRSPLFDRIDDFERRDAPLFMTANGRCQDIAHVV